MRRLLVISSSLGEGGAQRVTSTLLAHLDRARFAASLCVFKPVVTFPVPADVPVTVLGSERDAPLAELARRRPWLIADLMLRLRRHIARERPDVILSNIEQVNSVTGTALLGMRRRPRWVARFGSHPDHQGALAAAWARWTIGGADAVVVSSDDLGARVAERYPAIRAKVRCLPNPTDFARIDALAAEPAARSPAPLVIAVGRLSPEKRVDRMLDAIAAIRRDRPVVLRLCGDGPLAAQVRDQIAARGLGDAVEQLGFCDNPYAHLAAADLFLLTSEFEGLPNALIEAQGLGLPAVAIDCRFGVREILAHGETGLLVPEHDPGALAAAIAALLDDPARRAAMGRAAKLRARQRFGVDPLVRRWEDLLAG